MARHFVSAIRSISAWAALRALAAREDLHVARNSPKLTAPPLPFLPDSLFAGLLGFNNPSNLALLVMAVGLCL